MGFAPESQVRTDSPLEEVGFEPSVPQRRATVFRDRLVQAYRPLLAEEACGRRLPAWPLPSTKSLVPMISGF
jgi:hypothetical protein